MAKRRKLEAPSAEELSRMEEEFRGETSKPDTRHAPPIAQVAREAAAALDFSGGAGALAATSRDAEDAERLREAEAQGLLMLDLPLEDIHLDSMIRDRTILDAEALEELRRSILKNGMRLPIEVYQLQNDGSEEAGQGPRFGLLSGYRRLYVLRGLREMMGPGHFDTVRAILRRPETDADRFAAMVEENEVRQQLSHFERGRICALAAQQGIFANTEAAVAALYPNASKAKRSKIRSFAMIFEELGDVLSFAENLREKEGLKIASALRDGHDDAIREAMGHVRPSSAREEWEAILAVLSQFAAPPHTKSRGGRPRTKLNESGWDGRKLRLNNGIELRKSQDSRGYNLRISGSKVSHDLLEDVVNRIIYWLDDPDNENKKNDF